MGQWLLKNQSLTSMMTWFFLCINAVFTTESGPDTSCVWPSFHEVSNIDRAFEDTWTLFVTNKTSFSQPTCHSYFWVPAAHLRDSNFSEVHLTERNTCWNGLGLITILILSKTEEMSMTYLKAHRTASMLRLPFLFIFFALAGIYIVLINRIIYNHTAYKSRWNPKKTGTSQHYVPMCTSDQWSLAHMMHLELWMHGQCCNENASTSQCCKEALNV